MIHLDTHVVAWLYAGRIDLLPDRVRARIDTNELRISPIVALELQYLFEVGKTRDPGTRVLEALEPEIGLKHCDRPFADVVAMAMSESWTRDPVDRITVAQASLAGAPLLTRDRTIHEHYERAVWDD